MSPIEKTCKLFDKFVDLALYELGRCQGLGMVEIDPEAAGRIGGEAEKLKILVREALGLYPTRMHPNAAPEPDYIEPTTYDLDVGPEKELTRKSQGAKAQGKAGSRSTKKNGAKGK